MIVTWPILLSHSFSYSIIILLASHFFSRMAERVRVYALDEWQLCVRKFNLNCGNDDVYQCEVGSHTLASMNLVCVCVLCAYQMTQSNLHTHTNIQTYIIVKFHSIVHGVKPSIAQFSIEMNTCNKRKWNKIVKRDESNYDRQNNAGMDLYWCLLISTWFFYGSTRFACESFFST